jgi:hypothetical protein
MTTTNAERGQALIEFIIFLPLIVTLYSVISGFANSINGSINQQKVARAYFYNRIQNNSTIPGPKLVSESFAGWSLFSVFFIGWKDYFEPGSSSPVMSCYKVNIPLKNGQAEDKCAEEYTQARTLWVRVGTVYGVCGGTYFQSNGKVFYVPDNRQTTFSSVVDKSSCTISR